MPSLGAQFTRSIADKGDQSVLSIAESPADLDTQTSGFEATLASVSSENVANIVNKGAFLLSANLDFLHAKVASTIKVVALLIQQRSRRIDSRR